MSNLESKMFEIFLSDQLFCSLYSALNFMEEKYQAPSPINIWMDSLQIMQEIGNISRADLIIGRMFAEKSQIEALCEDTAGKK